MVQVFDGLSFDGVGVRDRHIGLGFGLGLVLTIRILMVRVLTSHWFRVSDRISVSQSALHPQAHGSTDSWGRRWDVPHVSCFNDQRSVSLSARRVVWQAELTFIHN